MEILTRKQCCPGEIYFLPQFVAWKESLANLPEELNVFEKWLFTASAKVLFGDKPGELLLLREDAFDLDMTSLLERAEVITRSWGVFMYIFGIIPLGAKIVIYHRQRVNRALKEARSTPLFVRSGLADYTLAEDFFSEIARRWKETGDFPHEIAIALGYPIKDVVGYLGLTEQKYFGSFGWRVYGPPEPSLRLRDRFNHAKEVALGFLEGHVAETVISPENIN